METTMIGDSDNEPNLTEKAEMAADEILKTGMDIIAQHDNRYKEFLINSNEIEQLANTTSATKILEILVGLPEVDDYVLR